MDIKLIHSNKDDIELLKAFIELNTNSIKSFRYFDKRDYSIINNHIYTALYYNDNKCVGYGHLDSENDRIWLGVVVSDDEHGKGIGNFIINNLVNNTDRDIYLTVDTNNYNAIHLYEKYGFLKIKKENNYHLMKLSK